MRGKKKMVEREIVSCQGCSHLIYKASAKKVVQKNSGLLYTTMNNGWSSTITDSPSWYGYKCAPAYDSFEHVYETKREEGDGSWSERQVLVATHYYINNIEVTEDGRPFLNPDDCNSGGEVLR